MYPASAELNASKTNESPTSGDEDSVLAVIAKRTAAHDKYCQHFIFRFEKCHRTFRDMTGNFYHFLITRILSGYPCTFPKGIDEAKYAEYRESI
jgi:hypothetical protein